MGRAAKLISVPALVCTGALFLAACGSEGVDVAQDSPYREGAELFADRCAGCHTLTAAGAEGSASSIRYQERTAGPNLDERRESYEDVLFAIRNGGFSGAIMPQNIVVGPEAEAVSRFVARYAGEQAEAATDTAQPGGTDEQLEPVPPPGETPSPDESQDGDGVPEPPAGDVPEGQGQ